MKDQMHLCRYIVAVSAIGACKLALTNTVYAQELFPVPDDTLGPEPSVVEFVDETTRRIGGGVSQGQNLFHSFSEFSIGDGLQVYFANPIDVGNIFSRVTGDNPSNIFGTLGVEGAANLFLLNPNGILFGPGANLDIDGSFVSTTADAIQFGTQGSFSATEPTVPALLNVQPSALFFSQVAAQRNTSIRSEGELNVDPNQNLFLVGGDIALDGGQLNAPDGRVELAGISEGSVGLVFGDNVFNLSIPEGLNRSDIVLLNGSRVDVLGTGLGSIAVYSENLEVLEASKLIAGMASTPSFPVDQPGDITIEATGSLVFSGAVFGSGGWDRSAISNTTSSTAVGSSGDIDISTRALEVTRGAEINTSVRGQGTAGNITIEASESVDLIRGEIQDNRFAPSRIRSGVSANNAQGGNISITTDSLRVANSAYITASSNGRGDAGTIIINTRTAEFSNARDQQLADLPNTGFDDIRPSGAYSRVFRGGNGQAGTVTINAESLSLIDGGNLVVNNDSNEPGELRNAGNIEINAQTVSFSGEWFRRDDLMHSGAYSRIEEGGVGNSGIIVINANSLQIEDGALVTVSVNGRGNAGNIQVNAPEISISGVESLASGLYGRVRFAGEGQGGNIEIETTNLAVRDGAVINTNTLSDGNAGRIAINAENVELVGRGGSRNSNNRDSGLLSVVENNGNGQGGEVTVTTHTLLVSEGADINTGISGGGEAGSISINASGPVILRTGSIDSRIEREGSASRAGRISISAESLDILERSGISTTGFGVATESSGNITIDTRDYVLISGPGGGIFSQVDVPPTIIPNSEENTGGITIRTGLLEVRGNAEPGDRATITTRATRGNAGELRIEAQDVILTNSALIRTEFTGQGEGIGGDINIEANTIEINDGAVLTSTATGNGRAGDIKLAINENFVARNGAIETRALSATGGNVDISAERVSLFGNSDIETLIDQGGGRGGNITINADSILAFGDSDILAFSQDGQGGNIFLNTSAFFGENYQPSPDGINPFSLDGNDRVDINASGAISGVITLPDVSFIENSLTELPETIVDTAQLIAGSCISRTEQGGSFIVSGSGGLPDRPGDAFLPPYATGEIRALPNSESSGAAPEVNTIVEPQGVFQLSDGRIVVSRLCESE